MSDLLISINNISFNDNGRKIFSDVSLNLERNDIVSIVGNNGAGKSVFLKIISGVLKSSGGTIKSDAVISYMPQKIFVSQHLPMQVIDFLKLRTDIIDDLLLNQIGITPEILKTALYNISGGQLQKVLFCAAIMSNPDVLILDEPEQNLDASSRISLYELMIKYGHNRAIIIASHDPNIVFKKSNKILHFDGEGAVHYDKIKELDESSVNAKIKDLFEGYFACKHS